MNILEEIQNCPVEWKELGEVTDTVTSPVKLTKKEYKVSGEIPIVDQGEQFIAGFSDYGKYLKKDEYIIFGDHSEHVKYIDFAFVQGADGLKILKPKSGIKAKYIYYCFCNFYKKEGNYKRHWSKARTTLIPIPQSEEIQEKIVQILDKFTDYVTELTSELTSRKKQYSYYRDKLLSFEDEVYQVEWKTILDVSKKVTSGGTPDRSNSLYYGGSIPWLRTQEVDFREIYGTELSITEEGLANSSAKWIEKNAVIVAMYGATAAKVGIAKIPLTTNQACCNIEVDEDIANYRYVYHWLTYNYEALKSMGQGSQSNINAGVIKSFKIPVPSLEIQSRIIQVLDNFDTVCNDLNIGLPKEIELRQKQYEYFRDKLLTFVAEGEYTESRVEEWDNSAIIKLLQWVFGPIRVELGALGDIIRGNGLQKKDFQDVGVPCIHYGQIYTYYGIETERTKSFINSELARKLQKAKTGDLIVATTSENVEDVGKSLVWLGKEEVCIGGHSCIIRTEQNTKFLAYLFRTRFFQIQKEKRVLGTKVIELYPKNLAKIKIILPSLTEQERIVSILDNFDTLTNSLSEGLPKEIELRQKQYEYWREQLLNFTR